MHISSSRVRSGGLVFLSLSEFSTVYCDQLPSGELKDATDKTPEIPLDSKKIKLVFLKGDQSRIFTERTNAVAEVAVFWSSDVNRQLIGKVPNAGKDWGQKEKRASDDETAG